MVEPEEEGRRCRKEEKLMPDFRQIEQAELELSADIRIPPFREPRDYRYRDNPTNQTPRSTIKCQQHLNRGLNVFDVFANRKVNIV